MRGKAETHLITRLALGITPAHAGKSDGVTVVGPVYSDHPRACGEKPQLQSSMVTVTGSPPRMRGKVCRQPTDQNNFGITPAHAGKRSGRTFFRRPTRDHPRACGEKAHIVCANDKFEGSPPRMRGKAFQKFSLTMRLGITPAHAGKSRKPAHSAAGRKDHPRACGEKPRLWKTLTCTMGSPPRMRGKVAMYAGLRRGERITPAHAGKRTLQS